MRLYGRYFYQVSFSKLPFWRFAGPALLLGLSLTANAMDTNHSKHPHASEMCGEAQASNGQLLMQNATALWRQGVDLETESGEAIKRASALRKEVATLRSQLRKQNKSSSQPTSDDLMQSTLQQLASQVEPWQNLAGSLRSEAERLKNQAQTIMQHGFVEVWKPWIKHQGPLTLAGNEMAMAHNVQVRSVHPNMPNPTMEAMNDEQADGMSLQRMTMSGQNIPPGLETSTFKMSREQVIFGHIEANALHTDIGQIPLNEIHQWYLILSDTSGKPIHQADIKVEGHMPGHVHGLPTQPEVVAEIAPGIYRVDGVKFQMAGWWVMTFVIQHQDKEDSITFNLVL